MHALPALSLLETRVLGVLVEKQHTVPDTYPLTLNALVAGCNQKTSRDPVIEASEAEVQAAVDALKSHSLVVETSGGRVMRYAHNVGKVLQLPPQSVALLAVLFLRGAQTPGEIRINADRLHRFGDLLAVQAFLDELAERREGPLVRELPRQPGAREARWAHLVSGEPVVAAPVAGAADALPGEAVTAGEIAALKANLARVEAELATLSATVARMASEIGFSPEGDPPPPA